MFESENLTLNKTTAIDKNQSAVWRVTALWALSESTLGGLLHAFKVPFRGMFINGAAVVFISLIAFLSENRKEIFKSTLLVLLVKGVVSPHTPLTAYFAVFIQGLLGQLLFFKKNFFRISAATLGILTSLLSSLQKIVILTLVFGNTLWESIDQFAAFVIKLFFKEDVGINFRFSYLLAGTYVAIHVLFGLMIGILAGKIPGWINNIVKDDFSFTAEPEYKLPKIKTTKGKRKHWWNRPSGIVLFSFAVIMVVLSYLFPFFDSNKPLEIIIMFVRAVVIMLIWYKLLAPAAIKILNKLLKKKQNIYSKQISSIVEMFPQLRYIIKYSWEISSSEKKLKRIKSFIIYSLSFLLLSDTE